MGNALGKFLSAGLKRTGVKIMEKFNSGNGKKIFSMLWGRYLGVTLYQEDMGRGNWAL